MSLWLFCTIAAVLFLGAIYLLYFGLWGDRSKGGLRCPKCWYDMTGSFEAGKLVCPECGNDAETEKRLHLARRRWPRVVVALVLLLPHGYGTYIGIGWYLNRDSLEVTKHFAGLSLGFPIESTGPKRLVDNLPEPIAFYFERPRDLSIYRGVYLRGTKVTDGDLIYLKELPRLKSLNLSDTQVTDAGLAHLEGLTQLRYLALWNTQVTDGGLVYLKGMTQLQLLSLFDTQVTNEGIAELQKALPDCYILQ